MTHPKAINTLHREKCSCVIALPDGSVIIGHNRGVKDLFEMQSALSGAFIADKVVGKGAAALMVTGRVRGVYANVISRPALALLQENDINVSYKTLVDNIINRAGTDICPVEKLTAKCTTASECLPLIEQFIKDLNSHN